MSIHDMELEATFRVSAGTTLPMVWDALKPFCARYGVVALQGEPIPEMGAVPLTRSDCDIALSDGEVYLLLPCRSAAGTAPDELDSLCARLNPLVANFGWLEVTDFDAPAGSAEAGAVRFIGPTAEARRSAQIEYGIDQARLWLEGVLAPGVLSDLRARALAGVQREGD